MKYMYLGNKGCILRDISHGHAAFPPSPYGSHESVDQLECTKLAVQRRLADLFITKELINDSRLDHADIICRRNYVLSSKEEREQRHRCLFTTLFPPLGISVGRGGR